MLQTITETTSTSLAILIMFGCLEYIRTKIGCLKVMDDSNAKCQNMRLRGGPTVVCRFKFKSSEARSGRFVIDGLLILAFRNLAVRTASHWHLKILQILKGL